MSHDLVRRDFIRWLIGTLVIMFLLACKRAVSTILGPEEVSPEGVQSLKRKRLLDRPPNGAKYSLANLLDRRFSSWTRWTDYPCLGDGVWQIPQLMDNGLCWIYRNRRLLIQNDNNVDSPVFRPGDLVKLTEPSSNGRTLWHYRVPWPAYQAQLATD